MFAVLTARRSDRLRDLADELTANHANQVETCPLDLTDPAAPHSLYRFTAKRGLSIEVLVNNAGIAQYREFCKGDIDKQLAMIQLHCSVVLHITHRYRQGRIGRRSG
jgi:short-subunit dehydrogenase